jgi:hypothetical protein
MICAFVRRRLGVAVNRKRVLRVMREGVGLSEDEIPF